MIKKLPCSLIFITLAISVFTCCIDSIVAQEVYFAEDPPMVLDGNKLVFNGYTIEYSAKSHSVIFLELWNEDALVGKGTFQTRKRGSNTASMNIQVINSSKKLANGKNYHYKLVMYEEEVDNTSKKSQTQRSTFTSTFANTSPPQRKLKVVAQPIIIRGVSVVRE